MTLESLLVAEVYGILILFVRLGAALMVLPGFGEPYVLSRFRLFLGLMLALVLSLPLAEQLPPPPDGVGVLAGQVVTEAAFGLFIGATARLILAATHFAGAIVAMQSGLAAAMFFDPNEGGQSTITGNFLTTFVLVLLFVSDGHHLLLLGLASSYDVVGVGASLPLADMAETIARLSSLALATGFKIAAPILLVGIVLYLLMGILNRLMPQLQVLFVIMPLQIVLALGVLLLSLGFAVEVVFAFFEDSLAWLEQP